MTLPGATMSDSKSIRKRLERIEHLKEEKARIEDCIMILEHEVKEMRKE
jgi:uncharacterized protein (UPF0335 family)